MKRLWCCLAAIMALTTATTTQAMAAVILATFEGTVTSGWDDNGVFGLPGDLSGRAFTATYTYDTSLGQRTTSPAYDDIHGGASYGATPTPMLGAVLTIGGYSDAFGGQYDGKVYTFADALFRAEAHETLTPANILFNTFSGASPATVDQFFSAAGPGYGFVQRSGATTYLANLQTARLTITEFTSAVPEPATWAMMIAGFFSLGAALRRGRAQRRAAA